MKTEERWTQDGELPLAVRVAARLRRFVDVVGAFGAWLIVPVVAITAIDVIGRKVGYEDDDGRIYRLQMWLADTFGKFFQSTILQELEWHFHTGLFALVLGYGVVYNTHVRIDLIRDHLQFRKKAWLELVVGGIMGAYAVPTFAMVLVSAFSWLGLQAVRQRNGRRVLQTAVAGSISIGGTLLAYAPLLLVSGADKLFGNNPGTVSHPLHDEVMNPISFFDWLAFF